MLSEEKIKIMTSLAMFEKNEGTNVFPPNNYFKKDYVGSRMFRSFFSYTFGFLLCLVVYVLYSIEGWMNAMNPDGLVETGIVVAVLYGVGLLAYLIISYVVFSDRYEYAFRGMKVYLARLKRLDKRYEGVPKPAARTKGGRA